MMLPTTFSLCLTFLIFFSGSKCILYRHHWYSRYGAVNNGRLVSEGQLQGRQSRLECSRLCTEIYRCKSFQVTKSNDNRKPTCYTFNSYMHTRWMVPSLYTSYYEKRYCMNVFETKAAVYLGGFLLAFNNEDIVVISASKIGNTYYWRQYWKRSVSSVFPGYSKNVDGATEFYGSKTMLISGDSVACFSSNDLKFSSVACPKDIIASYFHETGFSSLDGITSVDDTFLELYIFKNDVTYHLLYDENQEKYLLSTTMNVTESANPWSETPYGIESVAHYVDNIYFMFESHKVHLYYTGYKVTWPYQIVCDNE